MILELLKVKQYYKNLLIFLPLIFVGRLLDLDLFILTVMGFALLCFISSSSYIINDLADQKKDQLHPEKRTRPIASGKISKSLAVFISIMLAIVSLSAAFYLSRGFFITLAILFILTQLYTFFLKQEPFIDIITIAINFVLRAVSGAVLINVETSPWLIICVFSLSLFLSTGKRFGDILYLKEKAYETRAVLKYYSKDVAQFLMTLTTVILILSYALYSFLGVHKNLILTLPFAFYVILRYTSLVYSNSIIARHPEMIYNDYKLILGILFWSLATIIIIYL